MSPNSLTLTNDQDNLQETNFNIDLNDNHGKNNLNSCTYEGYNSIKNVSVENIKRNTSDYNIGDTNVDHLIYYANISEAVEYNSQDKSSWLDYDSFGEENFEADLDDELTNLDWLCNSDLLKGIGTNRILSPPNSISDPSDEDSKENYHGNANFLNMICPGADRTPYHPIKHAKLKPPYSLSCLIFMAIEQSSMKRLPVKEIYTWIESNFPYYQNAPNGWRNSIRHNLSLNKCFTKVPKEQIQATLGMPKGSCWRVDPLFRPNLLQALRKTPYHPFHQFQMIAGAPNQKCDLYTGSQYYECSDIDMANTLMWLRQSSATCTSRESSPCELERNLDDHYLLEKLKNTHVICTSIPSLDHTYSVTNTRIQQALCLSADEDSDIDVGGNEQEERRNYHRRMQDNYNVNQENIIDEVKEEIEVMELEPVDEIFDSTLVTTLGMILLEDEVKVEIKEEPKDPENDDIGNKIEIDTPLKKKKVPTATLR